MEKFSCRMAGNCCRGMKLRHAKDGAPKSNGCMQLVPEAEDVSLAVMDWEIDNFRKSVEDAKIYVSVSPLWALVSHKSELVVVSWNINHDDCPLLAQDNKCRIYGNRPLVCRMFPMTNSGLPDMLSGNTKLSIRISLDCPCWQSADEVQKGMSSENVFKFLHGVFGDNYMAALRWDAENEFLQQLVSELAAKNKIQSVWLNRQQISRMLSKGYIRLVDFLERERVMTKPEFYKNMGDAVARAENLVSGKHKSI